MRALLVAAGVAAVLGLAVGSPAGSLACFGLAGLMAIAPALLGKGGVRIAAVAALAAAVALGAATWPKYEEHMKAYRKARN